MEDHEIGDNGRFYTLPQAAKALGIPVSTLRRAANAGSIPVYQPFSLRKRVLLCDVITAIARGRTDG
jgi:excisionase family DNA binding protein